MSGTPALLPLRLEGLTTRVRPEIDNLRPSWYSLAVSRIEIVPVSSLRTWPGNPRKGNKKLIKESLLEFGQTRPLHVRRADNTVMMGNNTLECMQELRWPHAQVVFHEVTAETARKIMLMDNRTAESGAYDEEALAEMFRELEGDYAGTGWTAEEADSIFELLAGETAQEEYWDLAADEIAVEIDDVSATGAAYAEHPLAEAQRASRQAQQITHAVAGTRELVLVYPDSEHADVLRMMDILRSRWGTDMRASQIVLRLLQRATGNENGSRNGS